VLDSIGRARQDDLYANAVQAYGPAMARLARGYEADPEKRRDLLQEIHIVLWRSFERFDGRCSLRTWVYRVAHNAATSLAIRRRARTPTLVSLDEAASTSNDIDIERLADRRLALDRLLLLIRRLRPFDRQVMLLYLEGLNAEEIGDIVGISGVNVATKVHRIKQMLVRQFHEARP
jgi:RNA polymerase sigma-70 factor (ECF subfamily)